MATRQPFNIIDAVLILGIIGLSVLLVYIIWEPGRALAKMDDFKWESRARMRSLRIAEQQYYNKYEKYTADMDTLIDFAETNTPAAMRDSIYPPLYLYKFSFDSIRFSPMSHTLYKIQTNDTTAVRRYVITDPDGFGYIGSLTNPDEHNKASWEQ